MTTSALHLKVLVVAALMIVASHASADTYTNVPAGANTSLPFAYFGNAINPAGDAPQVGEVFTLRSAAQLSSFSFYAIGQQSLSLQLTVAQWNPGTNAQNQSVNTVGTALLTTSLSSVGSYNAVGDYTTLRFDNLGLNLAANTKYIAYISSPDASVKHVKLSRTQTAQDSTGFGIGEAHFSVTHELGWQLPFGGSGFLSLEYTAVTNVTAVTEPDSYALLALGLGFIGAAVHRRKAR